MTEVFSKNPFELLDDDFQPVSGNKAASGDAKKDVKKSESAGPRSNRGGRSDGKRGPRGDGRGQVANGEERSEKRADRPRRERGGRPFDRHSGMDRKDSHKKDVAGKGTWGDATEASAEAAAVVLAEETVEVLTPEEEERRAAIKKEQEERLAAFKKEQEEEEKKKTLDQFLAEKNAKANALAATNIRRANEGADNAQWKDGVVLSKTAEEFIVLSNKEQKPKKVAAAAAKPVKAVFEIEQRFNEPARAERSERGERGERGERRGGNSSRGGNRGGNRPSRGTRPNTASAVKLDDTDAFPSLGA
ncbi:uncharacterized protein BJ171DRAFT_514062 [Polychytrium aggregatum]|uniref:uncharacterized protein n=1 Tax=Polychytrium aggregatum TaxID=110093 RepID=UPI0022FE9139|nr:uncharacterized protein BJ171DRAFT_514062 [Polychytrium aggregatum]KAI9202439.1 hypothetical protein BJ171DRAFT_514062 [Polychytrium aggregatum]